MGEISWDRTAESRESDGSCKYSSHVKYSRGHGVYSCTHKENDNYFGGNSSYPALCSKDACPVKLSNTERIDSI